MRSCLPQGNLSVEEEFEIFGEQASFPSQKWRLNIQCTVILVSSAVASKDIFFQNVSNFSFLEQILYMNCLWWILFLGEGEFPRIILSCPLSLPIRQKKH